MLSIGIASAAPKYDPSPFGMNGLKLVHARNTPNIWKNAEVTAKVMKDAGIYWDRLEMWWHVVEPEKGKFDWTFCDQVVEFYKKQNINAMVLLCYSSAWSDNTPPATDEERAAYANYVYQMVNRYKDTVKVWEIWNEPNIPNFWKTPNVRDYTLMLQEAYKAAKKADPDCVILAAATSGADLQFIEGIHANGGWDYCDGISIHPYSMAGGPVYQRLDKILRQTQELIASKGRPKKLWITEMGWTSHNAEEDRRQAIYLIQSHAIALANGVEQLQWFCLDDWAEKWGLVRTFDPVDVKPSYKAYQMMTKALGSPGKCAEFEGYATVGREVACYVFKKADGKRVLIMWGGGEGRKPVTLRQKSGLDAVDILGNEIDVKEGRFTVDEVPVIVTNVDAKLLGAVSKAANPHCERPGRNQLNNGSLDVNHGRHPGWWNPGRFEGSAKDGTLETSDAGRNGSKCVSISKSGARCAWDATPIPVDPGKKYKVTAWIKTQDATGNNQIALYWYKGNMWTYTGEVRSESVTGTSDWRKVTVEGVCPADACLVRVNLISENNTGQTWFDDIELSEE